MYIYIYITIHVERERDTDIPIIYPNGFSQMFHHFSAACLIPLLPAVPTVALPSTSARQIHSGSDTGDGDARRRPSEVLESGHGWDLIGSSPENLRKTGGKMVVEW